MTGLRVLPLGDSAVTAELGSGIDPAVNARVRALDLALVERPFPGFREAVPTYRSLLVVYDPVVADFDAVREALAARVSAAAAAPPSGRLVTIPTLYGGDGGPDLPEVALSRGLAPSDVVALHSGSEYQAFMLGFTPGFAYLGLLPEAIETPRKATPRPRVAAGSVGIAGRQTAVYPVASPGGWNLIGRTSLRLFDPFTTPPALILPGDRIRFVSVDALPEPEPPPAAAQTGGGGVIEVVDGGLLTTVQDAGRLGYRRLGVTWGGPMDAAAHALANRLVGNAPGAAALECTIAGPTLRFLATVHVALTGADLGAVLHRDDLGAWPVPLGLPVLARAGNVLTFTGRVAGCRAYLAVAGGIDVPPVLGSRATNVAGGFGGACGRPLRAGDRLAVGPPPVEPRLERLSVEAPATAVTVRVVLGPQDDHLTDEALRTFLSESYGLGATSDRVGCRLIGPRLTHRGPAEIVSDGMVPGSIQVPPDGQPIVMMADAPTTGGYPKIGTVVTADLSRLAQLVPGEGRVRFTTVAGDHRRRSQD